MKILSRFCTRLKAPVAVVATAAALSISLGLVAAPAGASGSTITWTGNGTNAGLCASSENIGVTVPDGEQAWLFILTSPDAGPYMISTAFSPAGDTSASGAQQGNGNGSVHFVVFSSLGATLTSASAVAGTEHSVLTVSGCQDGAPATSTTTTTTTTTTTDPSTPPPNNNPPTGTPPGNNPPTGTPPGNNPPTGTPPPTGTSTGSPTSGTSGTQSSASPAAGGTIGTTASPTASTNSPMSHQGLAFTGADIGGMFLAALALLGTGGLLVLLSRNRRRAAKLS